MNLGSSIIADVYANIAFTDNYFFLNLDSFLIKKKTVHISIMCRDCLLRFYRLFYLWLSQQWNNFPSSRRWYNYAFHTDCPHISILSRSVFVSVKKRHRVDNNVVCFLPVELLILFIVFTFFKTKYGLRRDYEHFYLQSLPRMSPIWCTRKCVNVRRYYPAIVIYLNVHHLKQ